MVALFANNRDQDQTPHSAASDLGLRCLPITILRTPDYNRLGQQTEQKKVNFTEC